MDIILGFASTIFGFALFLFAAIKDLQTSEVSNWVWVVGFVVLPVTIFRMILYGATLLYIFQAVIVSFFVIIGFYFGLMGGADGKAILLLSLIYPWIVFTPLWLIIAPFLVLLGGFCLLGLNSLILLIRNVIMWSRGTSSQREKERPAKRRFWLTRRFSRLDPKKAGNEWEPVSVALIANFFVIYIALLILSSVLILILN